MIVHGTKNVDLFECTNPQLNKWRVRWNVQPDNDQNNEKSMKIWLYIMK